jgi:hypothetical protein
MPPYSRICVNDNDTSSDQSELNATTKELVNLSRRSGRKGQGQACHTRTRTTVTARAAHTRVWAYQCREVDPVTDEQDGEPRGEPC